MLAHLVGYVGLCWPHVDPCWAKRSEKWEQQKNTVKRRIFWWSAAYLGAMLAHLGAMLAHLRAMLAHLVAMLAHLGAMLAHLGAMLAHLRAMLAHLGAMLAHLGAMLAHLEAYVRPSWGLCWPMLTHLEPQAPKNGKKGKSTKHRKMRDFWRAWVYCGWGGGPSLLRRGENCRTARTRPGGPGRI